MKYENKENNIYLPKNTFISNLIINKYQQNYYFEIEKDKPGKIYVDFFEGKGKATAEIYEIKNDSIGKKIDFDYYHKCFDINENYINDYNCDNGCIIKIHIFLNESIEYESHSKYNIYSKMTTNKKNFYIYIPELEYVYGNLENENQVDYYKTKITKKTKEIAFYVNCKDCKIKVENQSQVVMKKDILK